jgi:hypothetical protein
MELPGRAAKSSGAYPINTATTCRDYQEVTCSIPSEARTKWSRWTRTITPFGNRAMAPARKVVWHYQNPAMGKTQMRSVRRTEAGATVIAIGRQGMVIEVDSAGKIIWTFEAPGGAKRLPYQAHRLPNGNGAQLGGSGRSNGSRSIG